MECGYKFSHGVPAEKCIDHINSIHTQIIDIKPEIEQMCLTFYDDDSDHPMQKNIKSFLERGWLVHNMTTVKHNKTLVIFYRNKQ